MAHSTWTEAQLRDFDATGNLLVRSRRTDGQLGCSVPVWGVVAAGGVYLRAYQGVDSGWFRRVGRADQAAVVTAAGPVPVRFQVGDDGVRDDIDAAYRAKYGHYSYGSSILAPSAVAATASTRFSMSTSARRV
jgi:hypothetical protein